MNHPGRSEVPCEVDQMQPSVSQARARSPLMARRSPGTCTQMRSSWLPRTGPEWRKAISPDPRDQDSVSFCNSQEIYGVAFPFALNWPYVCVATVPSTSQ